MTATDSNWLVLKGLIAEVVAMQMQRTPLEVLPVVQSVLNERSMEQISEIATLDLMAEVRARLEKAGRIE